MEDRSVHVQEAQTVQVVSGDKATIHNYNIFVWRAEDVPAVRAALAQGKRLDEIEFQGTVHNLPFRRNKNFTGRGEILSRIDKAFCQQGEEAVAITQPHAIHGLGGIGKTQIAVEWAYRHMSDYRYVFWLGAESEATISKSLDEIGGILDLPERKAKEKAALVGAFLRWAGGRSDWLLIYDNVEDVPKIQELLPRSDSGRVIITTRATAMGEVAEPVEVTEMDPEEAVEFLLKRAVIGDADDDQKEAAGTICRLLGYLPLAIDHAGAFIEQTRCELGAYEGYLRERGAEILKEEQYASAMYSRKTIARTWGISIEKVKEANPAAVELLTAASFVAPDDIPISLFVKGADKLPETLRKTVSTGYKLDVALGALQQYSLIRREKGAAMFSVHRLVQAVVRDGLGEEERGKWLADMLECLKAATPNVGDYRNWPELAELWPHAKAVFGEAEKGNVESKTLGWLLNAYGYYLDDRAEYLEAEWLYERGVEVYEKILGPGHQHVAAALNNLAILYKRQGRYDDAEPLYQRALKIDEKARGPNHPGVATNLNNLANLYSDQGRYDHAEPLYQRALKIDEKVLGPNHPDVASGLNNLALLYKTLGRYDEAEPLYQRAIAIGEKTLGPEHPDLATWLNNLASLCTNQGRYDEAEPLYQRAIAISEKTLGPEHPELATWLNNLALLCSDQGRYAEAEPLFQRAVAIGEKTLGPEHPDLAAWLANLALLYTHQGQYEKAEPLYQRALKSDEKALGPNHPGVATDLNNLAGLYVHQGRYDGAEPLYQRAIAIFRAALGESHPRTITVLQNMAVFYHKWNKPDKAAEYARMAMEAKARRKG